VALIKMRQLLILSQSYRLQVTGTRGNSLMSTKPLITFRVGERFLQATRSSAVWSR
jgi:hypothetical protein